MKSSRYKPPEPDIEAELVRQMIAADEAGLTDEASRIGAKLVEAHWPLVLMIASRFGKRQELPIAERRSIAGLAALKAIRRYRPGRGAKVSSFLGRSVRLLLGGATGEGSGGTQKRKRLPIRFIGDLDEHLPATQRPKLPISPTAISASLRVLDERQRFIVASRFGLDGRDEAEFAVIANDLGLSDTRVRQIYDVAIRRIRSYLLREHLVELAEARYIEEGPSWGVD